MIAETSKPIAMLKDLCKKLLYVSGMLGFYHRRRNADRLTVVMFHRILNPEDPRWNSCDPDYTLATRWFVESLKFFRKHYSVVSLSDVLASRRHGAPLPPRPLLITFDDGWADNADYALPELRKAGLPAVLFVVADAVGTRQPFFQECLIAAWRRQALKVEELAAALRSHAAGDWQPRDESIGTMREAISRLEALPEDQRVRILAPFMAALDDGLRHMATVEELQRLEAGGIALGLHGKTHAPMRFAADLDAELSGARTALAQRLGGAGPAVSMSFPHGSYDDAIARRAQEAGYELVFTSVRALNPVLPKVGWLLGRTGIEAEEVIDSRNRFRPDRLALHLFRLPSRRLA